MKVQNQEESNEEESLQTFYNLTDCLWVSRFLSFYSFFSKCLF